MAKKIDLSLSWALARRIHAKPKACWRNAYLALAELPAALYVEGWCLTPGNYRVIEHGWIETEFAIIEPTLYKRPPLEYFAGNIYTSGELKSELSNLAELPLIWQVNDPEKLEKYKLAKKEALERSGLAFL